MTTTLIALKTFTRKIDASDRPFERIEVGARFAESRPAFLGDILGLELARYAGTAVEVAGV